MSTNVKEAMNNNMVEEKREMPKGFVYVDRHIPSAVVDLRYASSRNFTGRPVPGYTGSRLILSEVATRSLEAASKEAQRSGWSLLLWDGYRPQTAVNAFLRWKNVADDDVVKANYHPRLKKAELFSRGLIASPSAHSRGSTVDMTLVRPAEGGQPGALLDTGTDFDLFDERSATLSQNVPVHCRENRIFLRDLMARHGFENMPAEWWHFTLKNEPFPNTIFDFPVRPDFLEKP